MIHRAYISLSVVCLSSEVESLEDYFHNLSALCLPAHTKAPISQNFPHHVSIMNSTDKSGLTCNICIRKILFFFFSVLLYNKKAEESITSLIGVAVGGGLFLTVLMVGVLIWISREREEDEEVMEEAQKLQGSQRRRNLSQLRPRQEKKYLPRRK